MMNLQALYDEFGQERVGIVRRELTMKIGHLPNYIELLAELCLQEGWQTPPPPSAKEITRDGGTDSPGGS